MTPPEWLVAWVGDEQSAVLEVTASGAAADAVATHVPALVLDGVASRLADRDSTLWGASAAASVSLGWTDVFEASRAVAERAVALGDELAAEGLTRVVLCGPASSTAAAAAVARTAGVPLVVLEATDADGVRRALAADGSDPAATILVLADPTGALAADDGSAVDTVSAAAGLDPLAQVLLVTDPGSVPQEGGPGSGLRAVFHGDPTARGAFAALTAFGLVPAALAGADVLAVLDDAEAVADLLCDDSEGNPAFVLAAALAGTAPRRRRLRLVEEDGEVAGISWWVRALLADATGGEGVDGEGARLSPVVVLPREADEETDQADDALVVRFISQSDGQEADASAEPVAAAGHEPVAGPVETLVTVSGPLGAQFLLWQYAAAVAGRVLDVDPFPGPGPEAAVHPATRRDAGDRSAAPQPPAAQQPREAQQPPEPRSDGWARAVHRLTAGRRLLDRCLGAPPPTPPSPRLTDRTKGIVQVLDAVLPLAGHGAAA